MWTGKTGSFLPLLLSPSSHSPTLEGNLRRHDQDRGWDLKYIMDSIMGICGISSCMPQPPEATLRPDEHMCEDRDICL